jgi:hypothetical protein
MVSPEMNHSTPFTMTPGYEYKEIESTTPERISSHPTVLSASSLNNPPPSNQYFEYTNHNHYNQNQYRQSTFNNSTGVTTLPTYPTPPSSWSSSTPSSSSSSPQSPPFLPMYQLPAQSDRTIQPCIMSTPPYQQLPILRSSGPKSRSRTRRKSIYVSIYGTTRVDNG